MAFCTKCGTQLPENAAFCPGCGVSVNPQFQQAPQEPNGQQPAYQVYAPVKKKVPGRGFGIASMVLGILGLMTALDMLESITYSAEYLQMQYVSGFWISFVITMAMYFSMPIMGCAFGAAAFKRGYRGAMAKAGITTGVIGLAVMALSLLLFALAIV